MSIKLKGQDALLLAEACKLDKQKKELEARIKDIKTTIKIDGPGTYKNDAGDTLVIAEVERFTEINPKRLFTTLKKEGLTAEFWGCVKVQLTPLKKILSEKKIFTMRKPLECSFRWSFK